VRGHYVTASPGIGKSHLAQALGHCAVRQGVDVVFTSCAALTQSLNAARATGLYERKLAMLARVPLLIIDSCGAFGNVKLAARVRRHRSVRNST
jgi:DNA replication protein DnaC